jgi:hypothetical protein
MDRLGRPTAFSLVFIRALTPAALLLAIGTSASGTSAQAPFTGSAPQVDRPATVRDSRRPRTGLAAFPPGPGRDRFVARCGVCHSPRFVLGKRYDRQGWERTMDRMIRFGARISHEDYAVIATYLGSRIR